MRRMTQKQVSYVQGILEHLLEYAERTKNVKMEKDIQVLSDILNKTAFHMEKPEVKEPQATPEARIEDSIQNLGYSLNFANTAYRGNRKI